MLAMAVTARRQWHDRHDDDGRPLSPFHRRQPRRDRRRCFGRRHVGDIKLQTIVVALTHQHGALIAVPLRHGRVAWLAPCERLMIESPEGALRVTTLLS